MAQLKEIEENILSYWKKNQIYKKIKERNASGEPFFFCDGPPYATGQIHPGTAWNKCLKDSVLRYFRSNGRRVRDIPGYDTHGLPIEVKVEKELKINDKKQIEKLGVNKFIKKCKTFATEYIGVISSQFARCGVWMDWERPYVTYEDYYIDSIWRTIKAADEKKLLSEGNYVVPQCTRCQTSLANYELEYKEKDDPSIYVKFKIKGKENEFLVIWTTTPWTLIANRAVMAHPTHEYVRAKIGDEVWIVAKARLEHVAKLVQDEPSQILSATTGMKLEGIEYEHPLQKNLSKEFERKIILSDEHVTLEEGTGLVHTAPGHGPEDFIVCKRFGIEPFCPVDASGKYTKDAGNYAGNYVLDMNPQIISDLKSAGALIHKASLSHRYPHCWRCKTPLIYIATNQWFIQITKVKERMLEEIDTSINFHPQFAKVRFRDFVSSAPDWCISRQRYWGAPLPIWICENKECNERKVLGSSKQLPDPSTELHRPYIDEVKFKCEKCGKKMHRVPDILDVWFDSGNSVWAQMRDGEEKEWAQKDGSLQAEFIVEGKDQTRGWFYSLLGSGVVLNSESPYRNLTMHGFFVDEKGEKMSKSEGNFVPLEQIIEKYGADAFRLWGLSGTIWDDLKFSYKELDESRRTLDIFLNMGVWMERFYKKPAAPVDISSYELEDKWLLSRTQGVVETVTKSFENFEPFSGLLALRHFLVEDVSRFYIKRLKQRINEEKNVDAGMQALYDCLLSCTTLLSPYVPFVAEHIYLQVFKAHVGAESVGMLSWPQREEKHKDSLLEQQMVYLREIINASANARMKANLKLRWPAAQLLVSSDSTEVANAVKSANAFLCAMTNTVEISTGAPKSEFAVKISASKVGAKFKEDSAHVNSLLKKMKAQEIMEGLAKRPFLLEEKYEIDKEMASVEESAPGYCIGTFDEGKVYVKTEIDEKLYALGIERELARRVQFMRKKLELVNEDFVSVFIEADAKLEKIAQEAKDSISKAVNAKTFEIGKSGGKGSLPDEWEIDGKKVKIWVKKL
ncbi:isoleucine--tRNA ligase [Candidatus Micrarchaeota archaeon CG10_big_fil_rev_8_21_14_0_10_45_29]|nr:MAG: isoleucine--tRNA ligase [Candidatus Micrarchaeota archaeon CG10_big_fil_rev_8_21_14_0_10_45_29]